MRQDTFVSRLLWIRWISLRKQNRQNRRELWVVNRDLGKYTSFGHRELLLEAEGRGQRPIFVGGRKGQISPSRILFLSADRVSPANVSQRSSSAR